eukprot:2531577-Rhodomonas_salina.1
MSPTRERNAAMVNANCIGRVLWGSSYCNIGETLIIRLVLRVPAPPRAACPIRNGRSLEFAGGDISASDVDFVVISEGSLKEERQCRIPVLFECEAPAIHRQGPRLHSLEQCAHKLYPSTCAVPLSLSIPDVHVEEARHLGSPALIILAYHQAYAPAWRAWDLYDHCKKQIAVARPHSYDIRSIIALDKDGFLLVGVPLRHLVCVVARRFSWAATLKYCVKVYKCPVVLLLSSAMRGVQRSVTKAVAVPKRPVTKAVAVPKRPVTKAVAVQKRSVTKAVAVLKRPVTKA